MVTRAGDAPNSRTAYFVASRGRGLQLRILANMYFPRERGIGENVAAILEITDPANTTRMKDTNGTGAVVIRNRRVGRFAYVGAGAVVIHDVAEGVKVAGVPAQEIGTQSEPSLR